MSQWLKKIAIVGLGIAISIGEWVGLFSPEGVLHEHTVHAFDMGPTPAPVQSTGLWGWPAVASARARFHLVAE
jgi:hypothetical protein